MQNTPKPPYPSNKLPTPQKSNKKLWIIFGSIAGAMIVMMGGCAGKSEGDYARTSTNSSSPSMNVANSAAPSTNMSQTSSMNASSRTDASAMGAGGLIGTWSGTLECSNGQSIQAVYKVAASGNPIYQYQTKDGQREVEFTSSGQTVRFLPPGGGVATVTVNSLSASSDRISYTLDISEERTSQDTLDQNKGSIAANAKLSGTELEVEMTISSTSVVSQPGMVVPGNESRGVCRGRFRK